MLHSKIDSSFLSSSAAAVEVEEDDDEEAASSDLARPFELVLALLVVGDVLLVVMPVDGGGCVSGSMDDCDAIALIVNNLV